MAKAKTGAARFAFYWQFEAGSRNQPFFTVTQEAPGTPKGTTLSKRTLEEKGIPVPRFPKLADWTRDVERRKRCRACYRRLDGSANACTCQPKLSADSKFVPAS